MSKKISEIPPHRLEINSTMILFIKAGCQLIIIIRGLSKHAIRRIRAGIKAMLHYYGEDRSAVIGLNFNIPSEHICRMLHNG